MKLAAFPKCYMDALCVDRTMTVFAWIEMAATHLKRHAVTGLEMYPGFLLDTGAGYLGEVRHAAAEAGFDVPMFCASPDFTQPDPALRAEAVDRHLAVMETAAALGCSTCRVLSGQRRPEVGREEGIGWVVECIEALLPHAERLGLVLVMENHFKDNYWTWPEFAQKMDIFCAIVERIESPWFGVNYDPSNTLIAGEDPLELLRRVAPRVVTMHASDRRPREGVTADTSTLTDYSQLVHGEIGTGLNDFDAIFSMLRHAGFNGWVSIEDGVNGMEELERSAQFLARKLGIGAGAATG